VGHVDEALGEYEADLRRGGSGVEERGERGNGSAFGGEVGCQVADYFFVLPYSVSLQCMVVVQWSMYLVRLQVQDCEEGVWVCLVAVDFDSAAERGLRQNQIGQFGEIEKLRIDVEELAQQRLEAVEIYSGLRVEPFKVDVDHVHVLRNVSPCRVAGTMCVAYFVAARIVVILLLALVGGIWELLGVYY
jgi:hypothetical protein